ncbi:hypothetical protein [Flavobacterium sp.]|uniref:hypothetical protein n=1 Tax=Flavobacterium sp. TaxID=239 RepID=UPI0026367D7C|nr:hypothetical protein [Flavobacterium sp.]
MDHYSLSEDIKVMCITADHFPEGIEAAHQQLHAKFQEKEEYRRFFGISKPNEQGQIIYKAAAEELHKGETEALGLESFTIKKGHYNSFYLKDYAENPGCIAEAFEILLGQAEIDPKGYCLEWYIGTNDVKCLVPVDEDHLHFTGVNNEKI